LFDYVQGRTEMNAWVDKKGAQGIEKYWLAKNRLSLDGFETNIATLNGADD